MRDLGDFLPLLLVSEKRWKDIATVYLEEHLDRNVLWYCRKHTELAKTEYDEKIDKTRNQLTLEATQVSQRLLMFNVYFLEQVGRPQKLFIDAIAERFDQRFGYPPASIESQMQEAIQDIKDVKTWKEFFERIGLPLPNPQELNLFLRRTVSRSLSKGYHDSNSFSKRFDQNSNCKPNDQTHNPNRNTKGVCRNYLNGRCRYGSKCNFSHH